MPFFSAVSKPRSFQLNCPFKEALIVVALGALVAILTAFVAYFALGHYDPNVPKTAQQARLITERGRYEDSQDVATWYAYTSQLIAAQQYGEAQEEIASAIGSGLKSQDTYDNYILAAQAELQFAEKKYKAAYQSALLAQEAMKAAYEKELKSADMPNRAKSLGISDNYFTLYLLEAGAQRALNNAKLEESLLKKYLKNRPTEGGVWVDLGSCLARQGKKDEAREAYNTALKYLPGYQPAVEGLRKLNL